MRARETIALTTNFFNYREELFCSKTPGRISVGRRMIRTELNIQGGLLG